MSSDLRLDPRFVSALLRSEPVRRVVLDVAEDVRDEARSETYASIADTIEADAVIETGEWVGRVTVYDWRGHFFEFGTSKMRARPYLAPALDRIARRG